MSNLGLYVCQYIDYMIPSYLSVQKKQVKQLAAIGGEKRKDVTYEKLLRNYIFVPIAVETFCSWGPRGLKFVKEIGKKIQEKTGN